MILRIIKIIIFITITFLFENIFAQNISGISIEGVENITKQNSADIIGIKVGSKIFTGIEDTIKIRLGKFLSNRGYYRYDIENILLIKDENNYKITINISYANPFYLKNIFFVKTDSSDLERIKSYLDFNVGRIFIISELENSINQVLSLYENIGYPFATINITSTFFYKDTLSNQNCVDIYLSFEKNVLSKINSFEITGNTKTKRDVILRAIRINKGTIYSQKKIDNIPTQLNKLDFFKPVKTPTFYLNSNNEGILKIEVKEKSTNTFDGILGYVPKTKIRKGYFTGFFNISLRNLFGTGRGLSFKWQKEKSNTQELEISYLEPWLFSLPFNLGGKFFQRQQDTTYIKRYTQGEISFIASENINATAIIESESIIPSENKIKNMIANSTIITGGFKLTYDSRNDLYSPKSGFLFLGIYKYSKKKLKEKFYTEINNLNLKRIEIDFEFFFTLLKQQILAVKAYGREIKGDFIEVSDLYQLGGTNSLRGYNEKQFTGNKITWINLEYRYLLTNLSYAFLFYDLGYYEKEIFNSDEKISNSKYGFGFGINVETSLGIISISYALGEKEAFNKGKIHIGLLNRF